MRAPSSKRQAAPRFFHDLLQSAIADLRNRRGDGARDTVLFLGTRHQSFPTLVVEDPVLEPVDKIIWMVIWQRGANGSPQAQFPSYSEISTRANIGSDTTIARALAILRATRWLSLCARVRGVRGQFDINVYAVHDEPLSLSDALHLDPDYLRFLEAAKTHPHPRVCKVAAGVLSSLDADIQTGVDVTAPVHPIGRRLEAHLAIAQPGAFRYFSFTKAVLRELANTRESSANDSRRQTLETVEPLQKLETVGPLQDLERCSSSINININKTTTPESKTSAIAREAECVYPQGLTDNQRSLARRYLERVPAPQRQTVLDELEGRLRAVRKGATPLYDPMRYLHRLCEEVVHGRFVVNLGNQIEAERQRRHATKPNLPRSEPPTEIPSLNVANAEENRGNNPVASIRRQFNLPSALKTPA